MAGDAGPDRVGVAVEARARRGADGRATRTTVAGERAERERVAGGSGGGAARSSVRDAEVAGAEDDRAEARRTSSTRERRAGRRGAPRSARRSRRWRPARLAGSVAASLATTRSPAHSSVGELARARDGRCGRRRRRRAGARRAAAAPADGRGFHGAASARAATLGALARRSRATISRAASRGRFSVAGSASGSAAACSGVSMSPGSTAMTRDAVRRELLVPDPAQVRERGLARAVGAPAGVRRDRGVAADVDDHERGPRSPAARRRGERAEQRLGQAERAEQVGRERRLEVLALGVGEQRQRHRAEARGVVDEHVEAAERAADLQRDRVDVVLARDVADDAVAAGDRARDALHARGVAGDEGDARRRALRTLRRARGRGPEVPPVMATRSGACEGSEVFMDGSSDGGDGAKVGAMQRATPARCPPGWQRVTIEVSDERCGRDRRVPSDAGAGDDRSAATPPGAQSRQPAPRAQPDAGRAGAGRRACRARRSPTSNRARAIRRSWCWSRSRGARRADRRAARVAARQGAPLAGGRRGPRARAAA